jgi:hypothetical protein
MENEDSTIDKASAEELLSNIDDLIAAANEERDCDEACKQERLTNDLKQAYLDAIDNLKNGQDRVNEAEMNYYRSLANGDEEYTALLRQRYTEDASKKAIEITESHNKIMNDLYNKLMFYTTSTLLSSRLDQLYNRVKNENVDLDNKIEEYTAVANTSDRKTYYESQQLSSLSKWEWYLKLFFWFLLFGMCFLHFVINRKYNNKKLIATMFVLALTPNVLIPLLQTFLNFIVKQYYSLKKKVYKNVYTDL